MLTDESVRVERQGQKPVGFERRVATIEDGGTATFALSRIDFVKPWKDKEVRAATEKRGDKDDEEPPPSRVQERRSFRARLDKGVLDLLFDTPSYVQLGTPELESLERRAKRADVPALLRLVGRRFVFTAGEGQMLLEYPVLGDSLSTELFSRVELPENGKIRVTTHTGARAFQLGDAFEIGDAAAAIVRVTRLGLPWGTLLLVWAMGAVAVATGWSFRERLVPLVLLSGVELLLALRLLIAYEGAYLDPAAASAAWQSLGAVIAVPFILQATLALYEGGWWSSATSDTLVHGGTVIAALATILVSSHAGTGDWVLALGAVLGLPLLLGWFLRSARPAAARRSGGPGRSVSPGMGRHRHPDCVSSFDTARSRLEGEDRPGRRARGEHLLHAHDAMGFRPPLGAAERSGVRSPCCGRSSWFFFP